MRKRIGWILVIFGVLCLFDVTMPLGFTFMSWLIGWILIGDDKKED